MQPGIRNEYQLRQAKPLRRIEHVLLWTCIISIAVATIAAVLHPSSWGGLVAIALYVYVWLPITWFVVIFSSLGWLGRTALAYYKRR